jgi:penicillin amidase
MTVSLEPNVRAWGHNAGGQSGNPGSVNYDAFVDDWMSGKMRELIFIKSPQDKHDRITGRTILRGAK